MTDVQSATLEFLQSIAIFKNFGYEHFQSIMQSGKVRQFSEGSYLMIENEPSRGLYIILEGVVSVLKKDNETDALHRLTTIDVGQSIGEFSLFDGAPRSATIQAECPVKTFYLGAEHFEAFLAQVEPEIQVLFYKTCAIELAARLRLLNSDHIHAQQLLWKHALRKTDDH